MQAPLSYYTIILISLSLAGGCRSSRNDQAASSSQTGSWQQQPIIIDGSDADWPKPLPYTDRKEKLNYAVSNDRDNVYILVSTRSPQEQQKIIQGGMTVWINNQAEKNESSSMGIGFPLDSRKNRDRELMAQARPGQYKDKGITLDDLKDYSLYSFKNESIENYEYGQSNEEGVQVRIDYNKEGDLIYEASVPLSSIYPQNTSHNFAGKTVAVGIFIEGLPPDAHVRQDGGGGGVSIGGGLGVGSFGSGGGVGLSIGTGSLGRIGGKDKQLYQLSRIWQVMPLGRSR
ncbi:MAG TPA: hypothetical protein VNS58_06450 [Puia sp.]|nr:hypothetical protein [Puia sp.]